MTNKHFATVYNPDGSNKEFFETNEMSSIRQEIKRLEEQFSSSKEQEQLIELFLKKCKELRLDPIEVARLGAFAAFEKSRNLPDGYIKELQAKYSANKPDIADEDFDKTTTKRD
jgi:hypothetical protein